MARLLAIGPVLLLTLFACGLSGCGSEPERAATTTEADASAEKKMRELALGEYRFRHFDPPSNTQTRFNFSLAALVDSEQFEAMSKEVDSKTVRIRDRVMVVAKESTNDELEDSNLVMFRRRLLKEMNRLFESGEVEELYLPRFRVKTR